MQYIGLKFILDYNAWFAAVVTREEAEDIVKKFQSGWYKLKDVRTIGGSNLGGSWTVQVDKIMALHTIPLEALVQTQQAQHQPPASVPISSGVIQSGLPYRGI